MQIEICLRQVALLPRSLDHVAETEIDRKTRGRLPVILHVGAVARLIEKIDGGGRRSVSERSIAEQKIAESVRRLCGRA